jgi:hypothetical protein
MVGYGLDFCFEFVAGRFKNLSMGHRLKGGLIQMGKMKPFKKVSLTLA